MDKKELTSCCDWCEAGVGWGERCGFLMSHAVVKDQLCTQSHSPARTCSTEIYNGGEYGRLRVKGCRCQSWFYPQLAVILNRSLIPCWSIKQRRGAGRGLEFTSQFLPVHLSQRHPEYLTLINLYIPGVQQSALKECVISG